MKKKSEQNPIATDPPETIEELGKRIVRLGEALQDENIKMRDINDLALSCGFVFGISIAPKKLKL